MHPRCPLPRSSSALVAVAALTLVTSTPGSAADVGSLAPSSSPNAHPGAVSEPSSPPVAHGLRTDRLPAKQRERWQAIVTLVFAEDDVGRPLHPTLRRMWDVVGASGHEVYVELPEPSLSVCTTAGLFRIDSVSPDGHIVAAVRLNLKTIDRGWTGDATPRGFRPFHGLGREGRYAEVLGHELGHAVWALADPARARHQLALRSRQVELARSILGATRDERARIRRRMRALGEQIDALEGPARAVEARVWEELLASQAARGVQSALSSPAELSPRVSSLERVLTLSVPRDGHQSTAPRKR